MIGSIKLRNYFIAGVLVIAPTAVSFYFLYKGFVWVDNLLGGFVQGLELGGHRVPGVGFLTVVLIILLVGLLTSGYLGKRVFSLWEKLLSAIPLLNRIYPAVKQIGSAVFSADQKGLFSEAVLIEYPRPGLYSLAFATREPPPVIQDRVPKPLVSVFLPTTPNPTSGFLLMVPRAEMIALPISVEDALKLVISGGTVAPGRIELPTPAISVTPASPAESPQPDGAATRRRPATRRTASARSTASAPEKSRRAPAGTGSGTRRTRAPSTTRPERGGTRRQSGDGRSRGGSGEGTGRSRTKKETGDSGGERRVW